METDETSSELLDFAGDVLLALGVLALGAGTAWHLSLAWVQAVAMDTTRVPLEVQAGDYYGTMKTMQWAANTSLTMAAGALIAGGVVSMRESVVARYNAFFHDTDA